MLSDKLESLIRAREVRPTHCFAVPGSRSMIDTVHPITGKSIYGNYTLDEIRQRPGYEKAELMTIEAFCQSVALEQDKPLEWHPVSEEIFNEMLEVLPPAIMGNNGFLVGEPFDHHALTGKPRFDAFRMIEGKYYTSNRPMTRDEFREAMKDAS